MDRWEYMIVTRSQLIVRDGKVNSSHAEANMNDVGALGWELVGFDQQAFIFKRRVK